MLAMCSSNTAFVQLSSKRPSALESQNQSRSTFLTMSTTTTPTPSIIRPGKAPEGPPGWEERRIEKQVEAEQAQEKRNHRRENSSGMAGIKEKVHKIGEKMHLVEPKDPAQRSAAQLQVSDFCAAGGPSESIEELY